MVFCFVLPTWAWGPSDPFIFYPVAFFFLSSLMSSAHRRFSNLSRLIHFLHLGPADCSSACTLNGEKLGKFAIALNP